MARTYLTKEHENWLYANYPDKSNKDLAEQLTEQVAKDNDKQLARLRMAYRYAVNEKAKQSVRKEIIWREAFKPFTPIYIVHLARRLHCKGKTFGYLSDVNRKKALATNLRRWDKVAMKVENARQWLRTFTMRECRVCIVDGHSEVRRMQNAVMNFNRLESAETGMFFTTEKIKGTTYMKITAIPNISKND